MKQLISPKLNSLSLLYLACFAESFGSERALEGNVSVVGHNPPPDHGVYSPSTNGKMERWYRSLHSMMAKVDDAKQKRWIEFLPHVTAAYNSTVHGSTSFSPNFLLFGRQLVAPVDVAFGCPLQPSYTHRGCDRKTCTYCSPALIK